MSRSTKTFIPLSLVATGKPFFSEWAWASMFVCFAGAVLGTGLLLGMYAEFKYIDFRGTLLFVVPAIVIQNYIWLLIIRLGILKERRLKKIYITEKKNRITDLSVVWGVYDADDSKLMFLDGSAGLIISAARGYVYGRPTNFEETHFTRLSKFFRIILKNGYSIRHTNMVHSDANLEPLLKIEESINQDPTSGIYDLESQVIRYVREVVSDLADTEYDYYLVKCKSVNQLEEMVTTCNSAMEELQGSLYVDVKVLSTKEIYEYQQRLFGISYINIPKMIKQAFEGTERKVIWVDNIIYTDENSQANRTAIEQQTQAPVQSNSDDLIKYQQLQEANRLATSQEYQVKVNHILRQRGLDPRRVKGRKREKLIASMTTDEFALAEAELIRMRLNKIATVKNHSTTQTAPQGIYVDLSVSATPSIIQSAQQSITGNPPVILSDDDVI